MTELENLKIELFALVERVSALSTKNEGTYTFTKEQLLSYSKFLIDKTVSNIQTCIKQEICLADLLDEAIELEMGYNREIDVRIDERAVQSQLNSIIEESVAAEDIENSVNNALEQVLLSI